MSSVRKLLDVKYDDNIFIIIGKNSCGYTKNAYSHLLINKQPTTYYEYFELPLIIRDKLDRICFPHTTFPRVFFNDKFIGGYDQLKGFI